MNWRTVCVGLCVTGALGCASRGAANRAAGGLDRVSEPSKKLLEDAVVRMLTTEGDGGVGEPATPPGTEYGVDVLVVTAHPDDESMYVGGTFDLLKQARRKVALVVMSHGEGGRLLEVSPDGGLVERRDYAPSHVAEVRDREMAEVALRAGLKLHYLYTAQDNADFGWTPSESETLIHWNQNLPGGLAESLRRMVEQIRAERPRVLISLDPAEDPTGTGHGHHKAIGRLVAEAFALAADPAFSEGRPHVVEEYLSFAPKGVAAPVSFAVNPHERVRLLSAHASQFVPGDLQGPGMRPTEGFLVRWRANPKAPPGAGLFRLVMEPAK